MTKLATRIVAVLALAGVATPAFPCGDHAEKTTASSSQKRGSQAKAAKSHAAKAQSAKKTVARGS